LILTLTASGKRRAKDIVAKGPEASIIAMLEENGPSDISEIAKDLNTTVPGIKKASVRLAKRGLIQQSEE